MVEHGRTFRRRIVARSGYVAEIRERIGQDPLLVVAAAAVITDRRGRVLLQHRSDTGDWAPPGGLMDLGESVSELLRREVREETGLVLTGVPSLIGIYSGRGYRMTYPNGDVIVSVICAFDCPDWSGTPVHDDESLALGWFEAGSLPHLHPHHREYLQDHFDGVTGRVL
jgi:8-oxo-dGTP pyrophosphatase MutT (NUDIX family)